MMIYTHLLTWQLSGKVRRKKRTGSQKQMWWKTWQSWTWLCDQHEILQKSFKLICMEYILTKKNIIKKHFLSQEIHFSENDARTLKVQSIKMVEKETKIGASSWKKWWVHHASSKPFKSYISKLVGNKHFTGKSAILDSEMLTATSET